MKVYVGGLDVTDFVDVPASLEPHVGSLSFGWPVLDTDNLMVRDVMHIFGVTAKQIGVRERRSGHRHRGTDAWARRKGFPKRVRA